MSTASNGILATLGCLAAGCLSEHADPPAPIVHETVEFAAGSALQGANGITVGHDGMLYVTSVLGRRILVIDPDSGKVRKTIEHSPAGLDTPDDVATAPDGQIYWTSLLTGRVGAYDPKTDTERLVAQLSPGVNPIVFSPSGRLFVGLCFLGDALYELDPAGRQPPRTVAEKVGNGCAANGMEVGPDGKLYAPQSLMGRIVRFDVETGKLEVVADGLQGLAAAVAFGPNHALHAAVGNRVLSVDPATGAIATVAQLPTQIDNLTFDPKGRLFVTTESSVVEVRSDGSTRDVVRGALAVPMGLSVQDGYVAVANVGTVLHYSVRGELIATQQAPALGLWGVSASGRDLIVSSAFLGDIVAIDSTSGEVKRRITGTAGPVDAIAVGDSWFVAETGAGTVTRYDGADPKSKVVVASGLTPSALEYSRGRLYVSDFAGGTISVVLEDGTPVSPPRVVARDLEGPKGISALPDGRLVVVEARAGRVTAIHASGAREVLSTELTVDGDPVPNLPPTQFQSDVVQLPDGDLLVSDPAKNRLVRITM